MGFGRGDSAPRGYLGGEPEMHERPVDPALLREEALRHDAGLDLPDPRVPRVLLVAAAAVALVVLVVVLVAF